MKNEPLEPLPLAVKRLLELESASQGPGGEVEARVKGRVAQTVQTGAAAAGGSAALLRLLGIVVVGGGAALLATSLRPDPAPPPPIAEQPSPPAQVMDARPAIVASPMPATAPVPPPTATRETRRVRRPAAAAAQLAEDHGEVALLERGRAALMSGDAATALAVVDEHAERFPRGVLEQEREALAVRALISKGDHSAARRRAGIFLERFPSSTLAPRVREALEKELR